LKLLLSNSKHVLDKIRRLRQGDRPALAYAADFRLLASDILWDEQALMEQFRYGLRNDVNNFVMDKLHDMHVRMDHAQHST
jgi:hypothetical protein